MPRILLLLQWYVDVAVILTRTFSFVVMTTQSLSRKRRTAACHIMVYGLEGILGSEVSRLTGLENIMSHVQSRLMIVKTKFTLRILENQGTCCVLGQ